MSVSPYLFFEGCCEEALAFYEESVGAKVTMKMRYSDAPPSDGPSRLPAGSESKIMHSSFTVAGSEIMASDGFCHGAHSFQGFSLALTLPDIETTERVFAALSAGGQVRQPLIKTFFSPRFGMVADKFGIGWNVIAQAS
jgi:PhnB protein